MKRAAMYFPFHLLLLPAFFLLHVLNEYYGLIRGQDYFFWAICYFLLAAALFFTGKLVTRSSDKAGLWAAWLLIIYFFFGSLHDFIKQLPLPALFSSYNVVLSAILLFIVLVSLYYRKKKNDSRNGHLFLNLLFGLLVFIELIGIVTRLIDDRLRDNNYAARQTPVLRQLPAQPAADQPDIFFIVFDEYTSSSALKKYYGYDNSSLDSVLRSHGFYIAQSARSNYNSTPLSLGSCLNMQYFEQPMEGTVGTAKSILQSWYSLNQAQVPRLLTRAGYEFYNFGVSDFEHFPVHTSRFNAKFETYPLYLETLSGRIGRDLFWQVYNLNVPAIKRYMEEQQQRKSKIFVARNIRNIQLTLMELRKQTDRPKFIFTHIMMPHTPFLLNERGEINLKDSKPIDPYNVGQYLQQVTYCNQWIDSLSSAANLSFARPRVVVVEGDHGFRDAQPDLNRDKQFMNLNTLYFSDKNYAGLYESISPVNTFRFIFNKYFHTSILLLKDSTILVK